MVELGAGESGFDDGGTTDDTTDTTDDDTTTEDRTSTQDPLSGGTETDTSTPDDAPEDTTEDDTAESTDDRQRSGSDPFGGGTDPVDSGEDTTDTTQDDDGGDDGTAPGPEPEPDPTPPPTTPTPDPEPDPDPPEQRDRPEDPTTTPTPPEDDTGGPPGPPEPQDPTQTIQPEQEGPTPTDQGIEQFGSDQFLVEGEQLTKSEARQRLEQQIASGQEDLTAEDIRIGFDGQVAEVQLTETGADRFEGEGGVGLGTFTVPTMQSAAQSVESRIVANQDVSAEEVAILPGEDGGFQVQFTEEALAERTAEQLQQEYGLSEDQIDIQGGEVEITTAPPEETGVSRREMRLATFDPDAGEPDVTVQDRVSPERGARRAADRFGSQASIESRTGFGLPGAINAAQMDFDGDNALVDRSEIGQQPPGTEYGQVSPRQPAPREPLADFFLMPSGQVKFAIGEGEEVDRLRQEGRQVGLREAVEAEFTTPDEEIQQSLTEAQGRLTPQEEQRLREEAIEQQETFGLADEIGGTIQSVTGRGFLANVGRGVGSAIGDLAAADEQVELLAERGIEATASFEETAEQYGTQETLQAVGETVGETTEQLAVTAAEEPGRTVGQLGFEIALGTAAFKALETGGDFARGLNIRRRADVDEVELREITSEEALEGELPQFDTDPDAPTQQAVSEVEELAADNPERIAPGEQESAIFHTTQESLPDDLTVQEGRSELPGIFGSPEASPIGLSMRGRTSTLSQLRPRRPRLGRESDEIISLPGDDVRGMPESATGAGYELRNPAGNVVREGLSRGRAKQLAEGTDLEVRPQSNLPGYEFLAQEAEEGVAYVRPRGSRTSELEAIYSPGSEFVEEGITPVRIGGRDIPFTETRIPGTGRLVPGRRFRRVDEADADDISRQADELAEGDDVTEITELDSSQINRRTGQPYTPPVSPSPTTQPTQEPDATETTTTAVGDDTELAISGTQADTTVPTSETPSVTPSESLSGFTSRTPSLALSESLRPSLSESPSLSPTPSPTTPSDTPTTTPTTPTDTPTGTPTGGPSGGPSGGPGGSGSGTSNVPTPGPGPGTTPFEVPEAPKADEDEEEFAFLGQRADVITEFIDPLTGDVIRTE